ncbi:MAG: hypothetical protein AAGI30_05005 [Planctomycetota bacterium]
MTSQAELREVTPFPHAAEAVLLRLRSAVARVVQALPGQPPHGATTLADAMNLQFGLARKVWRFLDDEDVFVGGRHVPGKPGFKLFFDAARAQQVPPDLIEEAQIASEAFLDVVQQQAGDRNTFDIMLATHSQTNDPRAELEHRRQAFRANGYILGVHCAAIFCRYILAPTESDPARLDVVGNMGFIDLKRLRPSVPWRVSRGSRLGQKGDVHAVRNREPLFPIPSEIDSRRFADLPLMVDFCSRPLPDIERIPGRTELSGYQFTASGPAGVPGTLTCVLGEVFRGGYERFTQSGEPAEPSFRMPLRTPAELAVFELLVHRSMLDGPHKPSLEVFSDLFDGGPIASKLASDRLFTHERPVAYDTVSSAGECRSVPRYNDLTERTFDRLDWDPDDFGLCRMEMSYPPVPAAMFFLLNDELGEQFGT